MGVSKFVLKLKLCKDEQKSEIFCSSFERGDMLIKSAAGTGHRFNRNGCFLHIGICLTKHLHPARDSLMNTFLSSFPFFSPLPLNKRKGHSSSRSSENKRPFDFSLCY